MIQSLGFFIESARDHIEKRTDKMCENIFRILRLLILTFVFRFTYVYTYLCITYKCILLI